MSLRILLLGAGGREHALAWKLSQSDLVEHVFICPGNGGTASKASNVAHLSADDFSGLVHFAVENQVRMQLRSINDLNLHSSGKSHCSRPRAAFGRGNRVLFPQR